MTQDALAVARSESAIEKVESGWQDLVTTLEGASLAVPPVPDALRPRLERISDWFWSTRDMHRGALYDPFLLVEEATQPIADYLAIGHVGHGVNSYFLSYQLVAGPLALFAQWPFGGVYMDEAESADVIRRAFEAMGPLVALACHVSIRDVPLRLVVLDSEVKGVDVCTWVALDGGQRPELQSWPRTRCPTTALDRGARELERLLE